MEISRNIIKIPIKTLIWSVFVAIFIVFSVFVVLLFCGLFFFFLGASGHPGPVGAGIDACIGIWKYYKCIPNFLCNKIAAMFDKPIIAKRAKEKNITSFEYVFKRTKRSTIKYLEEHKGKSKDIKSHLRNLVINDKMPKAYADILFKHYKYIEN